MLEKEHAVCSGGNHSSSLINSLQISIIFSIEENALF